jgi:tRNA(adenine34) deaminase
MRRAIELAEASARLGEVPVGAVLVSQEGREIGAGCNQPISAHDPSAHAEIVALRAAGSTLGNYRFPGASLYVTIEPCTMCLGALVHARVATLIFGTREPKSGAIVSHPLAVDDGRFNHQPAFIEGILAEECRSLMQRFFAERRKS